MSSGYVYVLINQSMPGLVKIGCTQRDSRTRAKKLYTTGVPTPFDIAFEVFSDDHEALEERIHTELCKFRVNDNREFFRYPLKDVINLLIKFSSSNSTADSKFSAISIIIRLKEKYGSWLYPEIIDVQIIQTNEHVWLETTREEGWAGDLKDLVIRRTDLGFIVDEAGNGWFRPSDAVTENARKFSEEFNAYSIIMTIDLFHDAACREVNDKFNPDRIARDA